MRTSTLAFGVLLVAVGCKKAPPAAEPAFSDAVRFLFSDFEGDEAELALALRTLEEQILETMDLTAKNPADRALTPDFLTEEDVDDVDHPNRDLTRALPVAVAGRSAFPLEDHPQIQLLVDHTVVEPYSPEHYVRTFDEGKDCWGSRDCDVMRTVNDLTKENFLMTVEYVFEKDFRWIDMGLPDPADPEAEPGEERFAYIARSWTAESFAGENGNSWIHQSFTTEVWMPDGDGTIRMLCLWGETEFDGLSVSDDAVIATTRDGIDKNLEAQEDWLAEQAR